MTQIKRPQCIEDFLLTGDNSNMLAVAYGGRSSDALDQPDTVSIEELEESERSQLSITGVDELTPVDTFLNMNGEEIYVTDNS